MKNDNDLAIATDTLRRAFINHEPGIAVDKIEHAAHTMRVAATAHPDQTIRNLAADIGIAATEPGPEPMRHAAAALANYRSHTQPEPDDPDGTQLRLFT